MYIAYYFWRLHNRAPWQRFYIRPEGTPNTQDNASRFASLEELAADWRVRNAEDTWNIRIKVLSFPPA